MPWKFTIATVAAEAPGWLWWPEYLIWALLLTCFLLSPFMLWDRVRKRQYAPEVEELLFQLGRSIYMLGLLFFLVISIHVGGAGPPLLVQNMATMFAGVGVGLAPLALGAYLKLRRVRRSKHGGDAQVGDPEARCEDDGRPK